ncbi:DUF4345 family protein [Chryseobacterium gambrini]|uniref:DUF4345 family protein n=1 Tax=Chryseobacterium gambrini TaxID=373672 RepID=A0ABM8K7Y9_9FLAO|nr:DUF4345 family protein [Chryseobacterium gambrini]
MKKVINFFVIIGLIPLLIMGATSVFAPANTFEKFGISPTGILTYSTFRGDVGGTLLSIGLIMILGLITKNKIWFQASLLIISVILSSRIVSIILDGWINELIPLLLTEIFNVIVLFVAAKQLNTEEK